MLRTSLLGCMKIVKEGVSAGDGTLVDECSTIRPIRAFLEHAVPMLDIHCSQLT